MDGGHLNFRGLEVFSEHALQRGDGRLHGLIIAEVWVALEALLQEVVRLLVLRACACGLPRKVKTFNYYPIYNCRAYFRPVPGSLRVQSGAMARLAAHSSSKVCPVTRIGQRSKRKGRWKHIGWHGVPRGEAMPKVGDR